MSLPKYSKYKTSGIDWLGDIPEGWNLQKLKKFTKFKGGGTPERDNKQYWGGDIPWVSPKDMKSEQICQSEERITDAGLAESSASLIPSGRILIVVRSGILKHTIPIAINRVDVALNQDMKALEFDSKRCEPNFFLRWVQGLNDNLLLVWAKQGATVESIEHEYMAETIVPLPSMDEQIAIATFLDRETGKIDALIAEQEKLLTLLAEKRQATISHAVTRGLNPNAPTKDSGVAWLGEVPAHWRVSPLKHLVLLKSGGTPNKENLEFWDGDVPWASAKDLKSERIIDTIDHITDFAIVSKVAALVPSGTILVVVRGMILARTFPVVETMAPMAINQDLKGVIPLKEMDSRFLAWLLRGSTAETLLRLDEAGHGTKALRMDAWTSMTLPVPPKQEQMKISNFLETETAKIDTLKASAEHAIDLLKERRSALITAAVTGKIDVRNAVPKELAA